MPTTPLHPGLEPCAQRAETAVESPQIQPASGPSPDYGTGTPLFPVVHEDSELLVINKPAGLVCHPTKGDAFSSLISRVRLHLGPGREAHLINRLDRETSGLVVVAKTSAMARRLRIAWETRQVIKEYLAIVHGWVEPDEGVVAAPLGRDDLSEIVIKDCVRPDGASALTRFAVINRFMRWIGSPVVASEASKLSEQQTIEGGGLDSSWITRPLSYPTDSFCDGFMKEWPVIFRDEGVNMPSGLDRTGIPILIEHQPFTLLRVTPETGRKHQIRLHLAHLGHPVVGDKIYGRCPMAYMDFVHDRLSIGQKADLLLPCQALHAAELVIRPGLDILRFSASPSREFCVFARIDLRSKIPKK